MWIMTMIHFGLLSLRGGANYWYYHQYADKAAMFDVLQKLGLTAGPLAQGGTAACQHKQKAHSVKSSQLHDSKQLSDCKPSVRLCCAFRHRALNSRFQRQCNLEWALPVVAMRLERATQQRHFVTYRRADHFPLTSNRPETIQV